MSKAFVHVGLHKTGTTTIQKYLSGAKARYNPFGLWKWNNNKVINSSNTIPQASEDAFFSWEQLSFMSQSEAKKLISRLNQSYNRVEIIIVTRDPLLLGISHKNQAVKHFSKVTPPGGVFERNLYGIDYSVQADPAIDYLRIESHIAKWRSADFTKIIKFEDLVQGGDLVGKFIKAANIAHITGYPKGKQLSPIKNQSLDYPQYIIASHLHQKAADLQISDLLLERCIKTILASPANTRLTPIAALEQQVVVNKGLLSLLDYTIDLLATISQNNEDLNQRSKKITELENEIVLQHVKLIKEMIGLSNFDQAKCWLEEALAKHPKQFSLLCLANDLYRKLDDRNKSLEYALCLITYHPTNWNGYGRSAQDLVVLSLFNEAKSRVHQGLSKLPSNFNLLSIGNDVYRATGEQEKSLDYALKLITHYPNKWNGYGRSAEDLSSLGFYDKAKAKIQQGLDKIPKSFQLLCIASDIYRASGNFQRSLDYARCLIKYYPGNWNGYVRTALQQLTLGDITECVLSNMSINHFSPPPSKEYSLFGKNLFKHPNDVKQLLWKRSFQVPVGGNKLGRHISCYQPFQYWSQGELPSDIDLIRETWNAIFKEIGLPEIVVFNKNSAAEWIDINCPSLAKPFNTAFHYAVEADVFRIAYASKTDCIWLDSDLYPLISTKQVLEDLLEACDTTFLYRWFQPMITNAFFATKKDSLFFKTIADNMKDYSFEDKPHDTSQILSTFGPRKYSQTFDMLLRNHLCDSFEIISKKLVPAVNIKEWNYGFCNDYSSLRMGPPFRLAYKSTTDAWQKQFTG